MADIGPLGRPRRGVPIGTFLVWLLIAAAAGAIGWETFGNVGRFQLGISRDQAPPGPIPSVAAPTNNDLDAAVKDMQTSQKGIARQLEAALVLLNAQNKLHRRRWLTASRHLVLRLMHFSTRRRLRLPRRNDRHLQDRLDILVARAIPNTH